MVNRTLPTVVCLGLIPWSMIAGCSRGRASVDAVIRNAGSDTMVNLAQAWAEDYARVKSTVSVEVSGGGSATGVVALLEGAVDLANCSRPMEKEEIEAVRRKTGAPPREWLVGYDALAVYVHPSNPLTSISVPQLAGLYGRDGGLTAWSSLGVTIPGSVSDEVILISRQSNSGTFQYFRQSILGQRGDFRPGTRDLNGSKEVVNLVRTTRQAIGYSGMGYATGDVKMLPVSKEAGAAPIVPSVENTLSGRYPLSRPLYIYTLATPRPAVREYMEWIVSNAGQQALRRAGYVPFLSGGPVR